MNNKTNMSLIVPTIIEKEGMGERAYDIYSRLLKDRIVFLGSEVNDQVSNSIIAQMLFLDYDNPESDIQFFINSPGGVVTAGLAIYDTMNYIKADVSTLCLGQAASMGAFLLAGGKKGKRYSLPNSRIMIHQPSGGAQGQATDIQIQANEIQRLKQKLTSEMANNCDKDFEYMYEKMERDNFLGVEEALEYGIIDKIMTNRD